MICVFSYKVQYNLRLTQSTAASNCDLEFHLKQHTRYDFEESLHDCNKVTHPLLKREQNPWGNQAQAACNGFVFLYTPCFCFWGHALGSRINPFSVTREHSYSSLFLSLSLEALYVCVHCSRIVFHLLQKEHLAPAM